MTNHNYSLSTRDAISSPPAAISKPHFPVAQTEFLRVRDIVRPHGILSLGRSTWYALVAQKKVGPGVLISPGIRVWSRAEVLAFARGEQR